MASSNQGQSGASRIHSQYPITSNDIFLLLREIVHTVDSICNNDILFRGVVQYFLYLSLDLYDKQNPIIYRDG